jgi:c-di-GMP-related signal transduction protein
MSSIEQRIERLESKRAAMIGILSLLTDAELENRIDVLLAKMGTSRELVIAEHGSDKNFACVLRQQVEQNIELETHSHDTT